MNEKLDQAFDELEFDVTDQIRNMAYLAEQKFLLALQMVQFREHWSGI